jgi:DNA polymerase-4
VEIAEHLRATIHDEQGITCSVGVAASMTMAKLASRWAKPDGVMVCPPASVTTMLHPLDVGELYGVGEKTRDLLHRLGLVTVGDLAHTPVRTLQRAIGDHLGRHLHDLSWGVDDRQVVARTGGAYFGVFGGDPDKSMGANETFAHDTDDRSAIVRELLRLTARVTSRMRVAGVAGRTVTITVRFADFTTITRAKTLKEPTDVARVVYETARGLYDALGLERARIRLVGVRVEGLAEADVTPRQLALGGAGEEWRAAELAADRAAARFGAGAVRPATLVSREEGEPK